MTDEPKYYRLLPTVVLVATLASTPLAAQVGGGGVGGGRGRHGAGMGMGGSRPAFDPVVLDGPPAPDRVDSVMTLDDSQKARYGALYQNLMTSTRSERDEVKENREAFRNGTGAGDRDSRRSSMGQAMQTLAERQKSFDNALREFLSKDQLRQYNAWREARRKEMRDRFGSRRGSGSGGGPPQ